MRKNKKGKKLGLIILVLVVGFSIVGTSIFLGYRNREIILKNKLKKDRENEKVLVEKIKNSYSKYVKIKTGSFLYEVDNGKYKKVLKLDKEKEFTLDDIKIDKDTKYFFVKELGYYVRYQDVIKIDSLNSKDMRYKNYLPFNFNVVTKEKSTLYQNGEAVYEVYYSLDLPVIEKDDTGYVIEFNDEEYLIKNDDILSTHDNVNTTLNETSSVPVTVYHFIYLEGDTSCGESICHSEGQIREEFDYLKSNNYFTLNTTELGKFIDGKIRLPERSILITIDDGARAWNFVPILNEYKINATLFLVSGWYDLEQYESPYLEIASHTHDLHWPGRCSGGQGSPLKCLDKNVLLEDLRKSREKLNGTKAFCFPFYEYNDYAISVLKEAGFEMAFIGGGRKVTQGIDKFKIPRIPISSWTDLNTYINYVS